MATSRQIVLQTVDHSEPERVPIDLGGHRSSGIMALAYKRLREHLGLPAGEIYVYDVPQQLAIIDPLLLDRFGVDTIELGRGFALHPADWRDWELPDGTPCKIPAHIQPLPHAGGWRIVHEDGTVLGVQRPGCYYFEQIHHPLAGREHEDWDLDWAFDHSMWARLATPPAPLGYSGDDLARLSAGARALRASTERAIIGLFGGNLLEAGQFLFGNANFLLLLAAEPRLVHRFLDRLVERHLANLERFCAAVGPYIDIINFGDDLGMQTGPQISPRMYAEFFQPRQKLLWTRAKELVPVKVMLHCCGGVYPLIPGMIEAGLDILQPVQISARDMEPERLKREFGRDLCLWGGGCDTREVLPRGRPEQVREHVRRNMAVFAPGGGYVFQQVHNIQADVPPENIVALFDAVRAG